MESKKASIIIPARNEGRLIQRTLQSLLDNKIKSSEIIVVVNGSKDKTFEIARRYSNKVLNFSEALGPSAARNEGAKVANGDVFIFLDADTQVSDGVMQEIIKNFSGNLIGVCPATVNESGVDKKLRAKIFLAFKNFIHKTNIYKGSVAILFCSRKVFLKAHGFDKNLWVGELGDFIKRAVVCGAKYKFLDSCYVNTSMRRYEKKWGYTKTVIFWTGWKVRSLFKGSDKELVKNYFGIKK